MIESEVLEVRVGDVHVTPEQVADANIGTFGPDDYVLSTGRKLEAQVVTNNSVRVFDGVMVYGGIRDVISVNKYYDIQIDNGAQGMNRNDIIVRHFAITDEVTKRGGATFQVIKGTPSEGEAADPEIAFTDLRAGALSHDMILHRVRIEGLNIVAVEPLYDILYNAAELKEEVTKLNRKLPVCNEIYSGVANHAQYDIPDITPYDLLVIYGGPGTYANTSMVVPVASIVYKDDGQFALGVYQGSSTFWELEFNFPTSTKLTLQTIRTNPGPLRQSARFCE